jgi:hypothetical protein
MKAYWGSEGIAPRIIWPRHYMEVSGQLYVPTALPQKKITFINIIMMDSQKGMRHDKRSGHMKCLQHLNSVTCK